MFTVRVVLVWCMWGKSNDFLCLPRCCCQRSSFNRVGALNQLGGAAQTFVRFAAPSTKSRTVVEKRTSLPASTFGCFSSVDWLDLLQLPTWCLPPGFDNCVQCSRHGTRPGLLDLRPSPSAEVDDCLIGLKKRVFCDAVVGCGDQQLHNS